MPQFDEPSQSFLERYQQFLASGQAGTSIKANGLGHGLKAFGKYRNPYGFGWKSGNVRLFSLRSQTDAKALAFFWCFLHLSALVLCRRVYGWMWLGLAMAVLLAQRYFSNAVRKIIIKPIPCDGLRMTRFAKDGEHVDILCFCNGMLTEKWLNTASCPMADRAYRRHKSLVS